MMILFNNDANTRFDDIGLHNIKTLAVLADPVELSLVRSLENARYPVIHAMFNPGDGPTPGYAVINIAPEAMSRIIKQFPSFYYLLPGCFTVDVDLIIWRKRSKCHEIVFSTKLYDIDKCNDRVILPFPDSDACFNFSFTDLKEIDGLISRNYAEELQQPVSLFSGQTLGEVIDYTMYHVGLPPVMHRARLYRGVTKRSGL